MKVIKDEEGHLYLTLYSDSKCKSMSDSKCDSKSNNTCNGEVRIPDDFELLSPGLVRNLKDSGRTIFNLNKFNQKLVDIYNTLIKDKNMLDINIGDLVIEGKRYNELISIYILIMNARLGFNIKILQCDYDCNEGEKCIKIVKEERNNGANYEV